MDRRGAGTEGDRPRAMTRLRRRSPLSLALLASLLLVGAAIAAAEDWAFLESEGRDRIVVPDTPFPLAYVALGAMVVLLMCVFALRLGESKPHTERGSRNVLRPIAIALALLAIWVMFPPLQRLASDLIGNDASGEPTEEAQTEDRRDDDEEAQGPATERSRPLGWAVIIAFALAAVAVITVLIVLLRQTPVPPPPVRRRAPPNLLREIEASEADLRTIDDPRSAVIACYSRMEKAVSGAGVDRRESDTPFELLERLAEDGRISSSVARRLTELFETAKFSLRPVNESMRMQALDCLRQIRETLEDRAA